MSTRKAPAWSWPAPTGPLAVFAIEQVFKAEFEGLLRLFPCGPIEKAVASGTRFVFGVSNNERIAIKTFSTPEELAAAYVDLMGTTRRDRRRRLSPTCRC